MPRYAPGQLPPGLTTLQQYLDANPGASTVGNELLDSANKGIEGAKTAADQFVTQAAPGEFESQTDQSLGGVTPDQRASAYRQWAKDAFKGPGTPVQPGGTYSPDANPYREVATLDPSRLSQANQFQADTLQGSLNTATNTYNNLTTPGGIQANLYQQFGKNSPNQYTAGDQALDSALVQGSGTLSGVKSQDNSGYINSALSSAKNPGDPLAAYRPTYTGAPHQANPGGPSERGPVDKPQIERGDPYTWNPNGPPTTETKKRKPYDDPGSPP